MINQNKYVFINRLKWFGLGLIICLCSLMQPAYAYLDSEGRKINPEDWRGRWVFINYWASWCDACLEEIPQLNTFYKQHPHQVILLGVNDDHLPLAELKLAIKAVGIGFPVLQTDPAQSLGFPEIAVLPTTFVINPQGKIAKPLIGSQTAIDLENVINGRD